MLEIREAMFADIPTLALRMRQADRDECEALFGPGQERAILDHSLECSTFAWTALVDGEVACMFGVAEILTDHGAPWMIGTGLVERHSRLLMRRAPRFIEQMLKLYPLLANVVDARNTRAIGWLRRMGFEILPARPTGYAGLPFHPFHMEARACAPH